MSEYQYYEFLAIDRPLDDDEQTVVRSLSTRARITATSFVNEYHWGDFKGNPNRLVERYYDAHLYVANWGTHRVVLRLPSDLLDPTVTENYRVDNQMTAWTTDEFTVLDFTSEDHALNLRMERQDLLLSRRPTPLTLTMYIEEVVLNRRIGGVDVMLGQLRTCSPWNAVATSGSESFPSRSM